MFRKIILVFLCLVFLSLASTAEAAELIANKVSNVRLKYVPGDGGKGKIVVRWDTEVRRKERLTDLLGTNIISIYRMEAGINEELYKPLGGSPDEEKMTKIGTVNINKYVNASDIGPSGWKIVEISFEDTNIAVEKKYVYQVSCGTLARKNAVSDIIEVHSEESLQEKWERENNISERRQRYEESADWPERLAASIILAIPNFMIDVIGMQDPLELIYQVRVDDSPVKPEVVVVDDSGNVNNIAQPDLYLHTFTESEFNALAEFYDRLNEFIPVPLVVAVVLMGVGILFTSVNPNSRITLKEYLIGLLIGIGALKIGIYIISILFDINYAVVKFFERMVEDNLSSSFLNSLIDTAGLTLGSAIITFLAVFSVGILNWQYAVRKIVLAILIGVIPIVAVISIAPSRRNAIAYWFREFMSQLFLQSSHAAILTLGLLFLNTNASFWIKLAIIMGLPVIASLVRRIFGAESYGTGLASDIGAAVGLGSIYSIIKMIRPKAKPKLTAENAIQAGGSGTMATTGVAPSNVIKTGVKGVAGAAAGLAGGVVASAVTGNPALGIAGFMTGISMGSAVTDRAADIIESGLQYFKSDDERKMELMGISDPAQLDSPGAAYEAGKKLFGGGLAGTVAGSAMAAGSLARFKSGAKGRELAAKVRDTVKAKEKELPRARQELKDYKPVLDNARARFAQAKSLYGPDSTNMIKLQNEAKKLERQIKVIGSIYSEAETEWNNDYKPEYEAGGIWTSEMEEAYRRYKESGERLESLNKKYNSIQKNITEGKREYESAKENLEKVEAEYARRQIIVSNLEQSLTREGIRKEFERLRQPKQDTGGGIESALRE